MQRYGKRKWRESKQWQKMKIMPIYLINVKFSMNKLIKQRNAFKNKKAEHM